MRSVVTGAWTAVALLTTPPSCVVLMSIEGSFAVESRCRCLLCCRWDENWEQNALPLVRGSGSRQQ